LGSVAIKVDKISKTFRIDHRKGLSSIMSQKTPDRFKEIKALDNISFEVKTGEILGILGLNGSGKSTLLRIIAGIYQPDRGRLEITGRLSPLMQLGAGFQGDLNAKENILINGLLLGIPKPIIEKKVKSIIQFAELENFLNLKVKHYSSGMRTRLAFSTAMQIDPDIFLVDEILAVGDWIFRKKSYEAFLKFREQQKTIIFSTHNLENLPEIANRVLLLDQGKVVILDKPEIVLKKYMELRRPN